MLHRLTTVPLTLACLLAFAPGCASEGSGDDVEGDNSDTPADQEDYCAEDACADRLADAMKNDFLQKNAIRWQCGDVPGVTPGTASKDDRGQEYCEYFAVVDGKLIGPQAADSPFRDVAVVGRTTDKASGAPFGFDLSKLSGDQVSWLSDQDDNPLVGSCVFTSWHWDITEASHNPEAKDIHGIAVNYDNFRMFGRFNNNGAARQLVQDALTGIRDAATKIREGKKPAGQHPYWAACMGMAEARLGVEWRVSDPTISAAGAVLAECGCFASVGAAQIRDAGDLAAAVVPQGGKYPESLGGGFLRGFRLGTWTDAEGLPQGCKYVEHDAVASSGARDTHTIVQCDLRAGDLANKTSAGELKEFCRTKYGQDVVVHVPLPGDALRCEPAADAPEYCKSMVPWALDDAAKTLKLTKEDAGGSCDLSKVSSDTESRAPKSSN